MSEDLMRQFRDRWQAVAALEREEQREASVALRWQQLNAILRLAMSLGLPPREQFEEETVRQRWAKLRGTHHDRI
ncbi:MAG: hypothetical protein ACE5I2_03085 [Anaerolineae bacterium]